MARPVPYRAAFAEGEKVQDRGVEDRSDKGVSLRTSRTSASIWWPVIAPTRATLWSILSQISRHRCAHVNSSFSRETATVEADYEHDGSTMYQ